MRGGFEILKKDHYVRQTWKNGQGVTRQIAIDPPAADFTRSDFLFRISSAEVKAGGAFSIFPLHMRLIAILGGQGIILKAPSTKRLERGEFFEFDGAKATSCELVGGSVTDFNVFYDRVRMTASGEFLNGKSEKRIETAGGCFYVFVNQGEVVVGASDVACQGDTIKIVSELILKPLTSDCEMLAVGLWPKA